MFDLHSGLFFSGLLLWAIVSLTAGGFGRSDVQILSFFGFCGYLVWAEIVLAVKRKRYHEKRSRL